jgi:predicted enzyme related to lactoylglutathione lyase
MLLTSARLLVVLALASVGACRSPEPAARATTDAPRMTDRAPRDLPGLANVVAFHDGLYSGGAPQGPDAFATLERLDVRTIISVDGAVPDVEGAAARGIRTIHLPIGYDGFDETRRLALARAARDARDDGAVYVHCHHGVHRSAAAAGTIAVTLGWETPETMVARMRVSGTASSYPGLYDVTARATAVDAAALAAVPGDFPSVSMPSGLVPAMVELERIEERLHRIERAGWRTPRDHPDLVAAAEAGMMADVLRSLHEAERDRPAAFHDQLTAAHDAAQGLEVLLADDATGPTLSAQLARIGETCTACHVAYRDRPAKYTAAMSKTEGFDYIELPATSPESLARSRAFFENVFGWTYTAWGDAYTDTHDSGVTTGISAVQPDAAPVPLPGIYTDDLEGLLERVKAAGGEIVVPIFSFPGGRRFHFREPSGNVIAAYTAAPEAEGGE